MRNSYIGILLISFIVCITPGFGLSAESGLSEAGVRLGIKAVQKHESFTQYDAFAVYRLPFDWRIYSGWGVTPHVNMSLGVLEGGGETGFIGSAGPSLELNKGKYGVTADLGINFNILDRRHFRNQDFGSILLFGTYIGINYCFNNGLKIGYRAQHISNGHLYHSNTPNPGLDLHLFGVSYVF